MTETDFLSRKAEAILRQGRPIPTDLFYKMLNAGIDIDALERRVRKEQA